MEEGRNQDVMVMSEEGTCRDDTSDTPSTSASTATEETSSHAHRSTSTTPPNRRVAVALYLITTALLFADQNLLAPNLSAVATEFGFDDLERDRKLGGEIALAFFLIGAPASFVVGCLADGAVDRRGALFAATVLVGEGACMATYWAETYTQLFWCRALTGFSVGGALPLVYSVLADFYEPSKRGGVTAVVGMGTGLGIAFGQGLAGFLGPRYGWRMPFLVVSIPAMVCAVLVWVCVSNPERGGIEKEALRRSRDACDDTMIEDSGASAIAKGTIGWNELGSVHDGHDAALLDPNDIINHTVSESDGDGNSSKQGAYVKLLSQDSSASPESLASPATILPPSSELGRGCGDFLRMWYIALIASIRPHVGTTWALLRCKSVLLTMFQGAPGCIPWGIVNTYLNDYLSTDRGMSVEGATVTVLLFGIGNFLGMVVGGVGSTRLYAIDARYPNILSGLAAILGCFPMWMLINLVDSSSPPWMVLSISLAAGTGSGVTGPIVKATLQNVTLPQMRGQAFALLNTFDDFGRGLGPVVVAALIAKLGGRRAAFNVGVGGWVLCGILNLALFYTTNRDEECVRAMLRLSVEEERDQRMEGQARHDDDTPCSLLGADESLVSSLELQRRSNLSGLESTHIS